MMGFLRRRDRKPSGDLTDGPVWLDRLIYGGDRAASWAADDDTLQVTRPRGPWGVGLRDSVASGWFDTTSGALVPGVVISTHDVVLDFGCGEGNLLQFCADRGARVIGIDNHADTLAAAHRRLAGCRGAAELVVHDGTSPIPVADGTATVVVCTEVLEHVPDPALILAELIRVAAPGARFVISVPAAESEELTRKQAPPGYFDEPNHINVFTQGEFVELLTSSGLAIDSVHRLGFFWSVWFALHWHTGVSATDGRHPVLDLWTATWDQLLSSPGGEAAKQALDDALPKYQLVIARIPADG